MFDKKLTALVGVGVTTISPRKVPSLELCVYMITF